jgi:choloylglycine hydrolase
MNLQNGFARFILCFLTTGFLTAAGSAAHACTDFRLTADDGTILITRSMEFAQDMQANLRTSTKGRKFSTVAPDGTPGLSWTAKYGYVYLDGMGIDGAQDGMNEQGLTFEALYLPNLAQYQIVQPGDSAKALSYVNIGDWALGNFATVAEVKAAINNVVVFAQKIPSMGDMIFPLHFAFYDATGAGLIVEYINGVMSMYENKVGVFTNAPSYDWQVTNLANYVNLQPVNPKPLVLKNITFVATGQGAGMLGLPGDISPPSRFVKTSVLKAVAMPAKDTVGVVNLAQHIINNVDIPLGLAREPNSGNYTNEYTQWVVFKDVTHKVIYYRTYDNLSLRSVDFAKLDFSEKAPLLKMPIAVAQYTQDMSADFLKQVS